EEQRDGAKSRDSTHAGTDRRAQLVLLPLPALPPVSREPHTPMLPSALTHGRDTGDTPVPAVVTTHDCLMSGLDQYCAPSPGLLPALPQVTDLTCRLPLPTL
ncbi:hypothetical protein OTU49_008268, partial [Cherax quadricarinatus]